MTKAVPVKVGDIVKVTWVDSVVESGWQPLGVKNVSMVAESVGYLVGFMRDRYVLSTSIGPRGDNLAPLHIPSCAVLTITALPSE